METPNIPVAFSESGSENPPPRKRGRPPAFTASYMAFLRAFFPNVKTKRGRLNVAYQQRAIGLLKKRPDCSRLVPPYDDVMAGRAEFWSMEVLAELGRIPWDDVLIELARQVNDATHLSKKEAVAALRLTRHNLIARTKARLAEADSETKATTDIDGGTEENLNPLGDLHEP